MKFRLRQFLQSTLHRIRGSHVELEDENTSELSSRVKFPTTTNVLVDLQAARERQRAEGTGLLDTFVQPKDPRPKTRRMLEDHPDYPWGDKHRPIG